MDGSFNYSEKPKKLSDMTDWEVAQKNIITILAPYLTILTRYFPFSLLWQTRRFHYRFKDITEIDDKILLEAQEMGFWFKLFSFEKFGEELIVLGRFVQRDKTHKEEELIKHLEEVFKVRNVYITKLENKNIKFLFLN